MVKRKWFYAVGGVVAVALIAVIVGSNLTGGNLKGMSFTLPTSKVGTASKPAVAIISPATEVANGGSISTVAKNVFTKNSISTVLFDGEVTLYSVKATAPTDKDALINELCFNVTKPAGVNVDSFKLFRGSENIDLEKQTKATLKSSLGLCGKLGVTGVAVKWNNGDVISAGTNKDYLLKGTVAGVVAGTEISTELSSAINAGSQVLKN
jgi:hypothetical protein